MRKELGRGAEPRGAELCLENRGAVLTAALVATLLAAGGARAQQIPSPTPQFDSTGFIQAATLDGSLCPDVDPMLWGGTVTVNGIKMIVPCNTILQLPTSSISWAQMFPVTDPDFGNQILGSYASPLGS